MCWLPFDVGSAAASSADGGYTLIDDYWPMDRNGGGQLVYVSGDLAKGYPAGTYGFGVGESSGSTSRSNGTTASGDNWWGDEVDRRYVRPVDATYCVWDLGESYAEVVVFPVNDGDWLANLCGLWGSNDFQASNPGAATWTKATLIEVYARGWSDLGEDRFDLCGDDYVTVWGWPSPSGQDGRFRFAKVAPAGTSPAAFDAEIDAVKGALACRLQ